MGGSEAGARTPQGSARRARGAALLLAVGVALAGAGIGAFLHLPALRHPAIFKSDIVQSPHWAAYHASTFRADDLVLRYASFNESPLQNAIYWVATWFAGSVTLSELLGVASYGVLSLTFFLLGRAMYGVRFGLLAALFIACFPDQWEFSAGFFSKFWAIPLLLVCVWLLHTGRTRGLIGLLPFAALAYPTAAVLAGLTASVHWIGECARRRPGAAPLFRALAVGGALAAAVLAVKYASPDESIGPMRPRSELMQMSELGIDGYPGRYVPVPALHQELLRAIDHPFVLFSSMLYLLVLGRAGVGWERSWTALFLASAIGYLLADLFFLRLYIPNRYTRYSMAVLLALWNARNCDLILARVKLPAMRIALVAALVAVAGLSYGVERDNVADARAVAGVCRFIDDELPAGVLVAGAPRALDNVMVLARRSVLAPYKLAHPWFTRYYDEMRERTRATLRAHFAADAQPLNELHRRWGATHFLADRRHFELARRNERVFADPYNDEVYRELGLRRTFYLSSPPAAEVVWQDPRFVLVRLPIPATADTGRPPAP